MNVDNDDQHIPYLLTGKHIVTAESCTAGLIAARLGNIPGCSSYFLGGIVAYSPQLKIDLLGVHHHTLEKYGAVSSQVAQEMAYGALHRCHADIAISTTGLAGPHGDGSSTRIGTVMICIATHNHNSQVWEHYFHGDRQQIRHAATTQALIHLQHILTQECC